MDQTAGTRQTFFFYFSSSLFLSFFLPFFPSSLLPFFPSSLLLSSGRFQPNILLALHSAVLCLISQVVMVHQRSWKLYDDWKEVDHLTGIGRNRTISRAMAGSGNRGQHASSRVAEVGFATIRNVPFLHRVSDFYPSQLQRSVQVSNPCALLVVKPHSRRVTPSRSC